MNIVNKSMKQANKDFLAYHLANLSELNRWASKLCAENRNFNLLQTTLIVDEAFMRIFNAEKSVVIKDKDHFIRLMKRTMGRVVHDHARGEKGPRRKPKGKRLELNSAIYEQLKGTDLGEDLDCLLEKLELHYPLANTVVKMKLENYTHLEISEKLGISQEEMTKLWHCGKAFLLSELTSEE